MKTQRLLIIDDEKPARDIIRHYLSERSDIEIVGEAENGFMAYKMVDELKPEILLLDVQMPKLNGFELLDILEEVPLVVFTTAFDEFAIKAFEVNAVDYLLKPFDKERLFSALDKAQHIFEMKQNVSSGQFHALLEEDQRQISRIVVRRGKTIRVLVPEEIVYISAEDDYVMIYTEDEHYLKHRRMKYLEAHLPENFIRVHRSAIVNIHYILEIQAYKKNTVILKMKNQNMVKASEEGSKKLREYLK
jgi:two-component system, LytTR family, response regulator